MRIATLIAVYAGDDVARLHEAVDSILEQHLPAEIESRIYLAVDGPTPPAMQEAIAKYEAVIHRVVRLPENKGLAGALNALIAHLENEELVFRMDADDISLPTRFGAQISYMSAHPEIDVLGTAITEFGDDIDQERVVHFAANPADAIANVHKRVPVAHPSVCMRRRVLDITGGYPERGTNEDVALWFLCMKSGFTFDNLVESHLRFRIGKGFWNRRGFAKAWTEFTTYVQGIYSLFGPVSARYVYPILRLLVRIAPAGVSRALYKSRLRRRAT